MNQSMSVHVYNWKILPTCVSRQASEVLDLYHSLEPSQFQPSSCMCYDREATDGYAHKVKHNT